MRVPINPQTRVPTGELGYERPVDVTAGQRALAQVVDKYAQVTAQDQKKKELFDVQRLLVDETNNIQQDFEDKTKVQPLGAPNFTQQVNGEYNTRHQQMVADLKSKGYSDDAVQEYATRLGTIRSQYVAKAIDFQDKSSFAKTVGDADQIVVGLSQYANKNPNAVGSALDEYKVALANTDLDAVEQAQLYEKGKSEILRGAREGFAIQHPEVVLGLYGAPNETKVEANKVTGELVNLGEAQKTVAGEFANAGFNPNVIAGFLGNFHIEGGYTGKKGDGGKASGIGQWRNERLANFKARFGKDPSEATVQENAQFAVWEMQNPKAAGMTVAQRDKILAAQTPAEAAELIDKYYERSDGSARQKRVNAALGFVTQHADTTSSNLVEGGPQPVPAPTGIDEQGKTGIPALDLATGPERTQMLVMARTIMNGREADAKAAATAAHEEYMNIFYNGLQDGRLGQNDLNTAYQQGLITDFDERKKAQGIIDSKIKKDDDLQRFGLILRSGLKANPYDKDAQKAVDAGFEKAVEYTIKTGENASPFKIALRTWERTGVLPTQGAVMIRGGLIGTDTETVKASAAVAANMLATNPNAFAGVEGGEDIGIAAANYSHYVDDLGMTADEAAQKIATQNSPEFKQKIKANEPERNKFVDTIVGSKTQAGVNIEKVVNDAVVGPRGFLGNLTGGYFSPPRGTFTAAQAAEAKQTYLELALDNYDKNHDEGAAHAYASRQMGRFYGVESGRLLKYPATKAYPEVMGSREYIFDQAKAFVDKAAGFPIPKEDIVLQPTASGSTAAAFRTGKPPPYEIVYVTHQNGQSVYHYIPGQVFVADLDQARREAAAVAHAYEKGLRVKPGNAEIDTITRMGK